MMRITPILLFVALGMVQPGVLFGQTKPAEEIVVGENVLVSSVTDTWPQIEPQLAADPNDSDHLLATAITVDPSSLADSGCAAFVSFDGGRSWARHDFEVAGCADPWVVLRDDGTAVGAGLSTSASSQLYLARSADGGRSWTSATSEVGHSLDHETMIVDVTPGPRVGSIYLVSQGYRRDPTGRSLASVLVTGSADAGSPFVPPVHVVPSNLNFNVLTPGVLSDGRIVVP